MRTKVLSALPQGAFLTICSLGPLIFSLYILGYFSQPIWSGDWLSWNRNLDNLYAPDTLFVNLAMAAHLFGGAVLGFLGPWQLIPRLRSIHSGIDVWASCI
ncbi:hypothetical protein BJP36_09275 [Moorena producens JHB]|uniref:Uncharacterized protein n=1 Tax=Moorena producens (strain JHB) TaxID=1454205 RepID=A0A1D9FY50_MOOP1|nr:hypothetical protein [Moorena producens]AOY80090.1 hypothetical protein BJP36_09275 [Moorena producens JHB]